MFFSCTVVIGFLQSTVVHTSSRSDQLIALVGNVAYRCFQLCRETPRVASSSWSQVHPKTDPVLFDTHALVIQVYYRPKHISQGWLSS